MKKAFTFVDLFAGIGGFKMALTNNGDILIKSIISSGVFDPQKNETENEQYLKKHYYV